MRAQSFSELVRAARKPVTWVPPSTVLMLFANARTFSVYVSLYWSATSTVGLALAALDVDRARVQRLLVPVQVADERLKPPSK